MSKRVFAAFEISAELKAGMKKLRDRDGIPLRFQIERAIANYLEEQKIEIEEPTLQKRGRKTKQ